MSIRAINWSMDQRTDGPSAQSVLFIIADAASEHGVCRHADPDHIALRSRQSRATVFRRLEELQRVGLLTRFTHHLDDGRRQYEVRLKLDLHVNYKVDKYRTIRLLDDDDHLVREIPYDGNADDGGESQIETQGESQFETEPVSPVRLSESQSCDPLKDPTKHQDSPQSPSLQPGETQGHSMEEPASHEAEEALRRFKTEYPHPSNRPEQVRRLVLALSVQEREQLIRGAMGVAACRAKNPKLAVVDPAKFAAKPGLWAEYEAWAPERLALSQSPRLDVSSEAGQAILVLHRIAAAPKPLILGGVMRVKIDPPPSVLALARFMRAGGSVDVSTWQFLDGKSREAAAWSHFSYDHIDRWPRNEDRWFSDAFPGGSTVATNGGEKRRGFLVPWLWPPRKDGSTGPPSGELNDDDIDAFTDMGTTR